MILLQENELLLNHDRRHLFIVYIRRDYSFQMSPYAIPPDRAEYTRA
jgi:hypothetical protein